MNWGRLGAAALVCTTVVGCGGQEASSKPSRKANDVILPRTCYTDYFVDDSDGSKDSVFTVYDESCGIKVNGITCAVIKSFDAEGVGLQVQCPTAGTK